MVDKKTFCPLNNLDGLFEGKKPAPYTVCNSSLSEYAVLGKLVLSWWLKRGFKQNLFSNILCVDFICICQLLKTHLSVLFNNYFIPMIKDLTPSFHIIFLFELLSLILKQHRCMNWVICCSIDVYLCGVLQGLRWASAKWIPTVWSCGRPSLETLPTQLNQSLTSLFPVDRISGSGSWDWSSCCPTVTRAWYDSESHHMIVQ